MNETRKQEKKIKIKKNHGRCVGKIKEVYDVCQRDRECWPDRHLNTTTAAAAPTRLLTRN